MHPRRNDERLTSPSKPKRLAGLLGITAIFGLASMAVAASAMLPRNVIVPLSAVNHYVPDVSREANTGANTTAAGNPTATRSVIYSSTDSSKKVTISVDQYAGAKDASSAYDEALRKSKAVSGFKNIAIPNVVGQRSFAGTVTRGAETHVGLGALQGKLIIQATLAGYGATPENVAKLVAVGRAEASKARAVLGS